MNKLKTATGSVADIKEPYASITSNGRCYIYYIYIFITLANPINPPKNMIELVIIKAINVPGTAYNIIEPKFLKKGSMSIFTALSNNIGGNKIIINI